MEKKKRKCPECGGDGKKDNIALNIAVFHMPVPVMKSTCYRCNGTGEIDQ